jgi:hypothetical protein
MKAILFNIDEASATLKGRKTMKRLICECNNYGPKPILFYDFRPTGEGIQSRSAKRMGHPAAGFYTKNTPRFIGPDGRENIDAYYFRAKYKPGNILYVRETWMLETEQGVPTGGYIYKAGSRPEPDGDTALRWHPSIHMPKEAARIFLRVTDVRVERLREITVEDVMAEGLPADNEIRNTDPTTHESIRNWNLAYAQHLYYELWDKINSKRGYGWDANPWVWVISFEKIEKPEGES